VKFLKTGGLNMAIIANVTFSKKIPVPDSEYSSQGYSLSLQTEIPESDPAAIQARLHQTFELVKSQVEYELANGNGAAAQVTQSSPKQADKRDTAASNAQIRYLTDLWTQGGGQLSALNARVRDEFGIDGLYELTKRQASGLLDKLKLESKKAA
jgi:hypothetical protein